MKFFLYYNFCLKIHLEIILSEMYRLCNIIQTIFIVIKIILRNSSDTIFLFPVFTDLQLFLRHIVTKGRLEIMEK